MIYFLADSLGYRKGSWGHAEPPGLWVIWKVGFRFQLRRSWELWIKSVQSNLATIVRIKKCKLAMKLLKVID